MLWIFNDCMNIRSKECIERQLFRDGNKEFHQNHNAFEHLSVPFFVENV